MAQLGERVAVGRVRGLHGLNGAVRVEILTDQPEVRFAPGARMWAGSLRDPLTVLHAVPDGRGLRVRFREIPDRNAAESIRDVDLEIEADPGELDAGAVYWHELLGVPVRALDGHELGTVQEVYRAGATEVLVVDGGEVAAFDLPVVSGFIHSWTPREGAIVVDADALDLQPRRPRRRRSRAEAVAARPPREVVTAAEAAGVTVDDGSGSSTGIDVAPAGDPVPSHADGGEEPGA